MLPDQLPQVRMGKHDVYEGVRQLEDARARNAAYYSNPKRAKMALGRDLENNEAIKAQIN
jgi:hypothetical protein